MMLTRIFAVLALSAAALQAQGDPTWSEPFPPHRVIGNIYYVGTRGLASYLVTTPEGNILINSSLETSVPLIRASIEKLGFHFNDVKILLISHAHWDHCAGSFLVKELTGAKYMVMDADVPEIEAGGKGNFQYGNSPTSRYKPVKVDRVLHDGDEVKLGGAVLTAHLTPGPHQRLHHVDDEGDRRRQDRTTSSSSAAPTSTPATSSSTTQLYPRIASRLRAHLPRPEIARLRRLPRRARRAITAWRKSTRCCKPGKPNPFIDPDGYKSYVAEREAAFRAELKKQSR